MPRPTGPTNPVLRSLIEEIRSKGYKENENFLLNLADLLEKARRRKTEVPLTKLNRICNENETVVVPGKVLDGLLDKKLTIAAFKYSEKALDTIKKSKSKAMTIHELVKHNPKGSKTRVIV